MCTKGQSHRHRDHSMTVWQLLPVREKSPFFNWLVTGSWRLLAVVKTALTGLETSQWPSWQPLSVDEIRHKEGVAPKKPFGIALVTSRLMELPVGCMFVCEHSQTTLGAVVKLWKRETEIVCFQSKSCAFWKVLGAKLRHNFYLKGKPFQSRLHFSQLD